MSTPSASQRKVLNIPNEFENATRAIRWLVIIVVILTFPASSSPQLYYVYGISLLAVLYNIARYIPFLFRSKLFRSPMTVIPIDTVFVCALIALAGTVSTPYSAFLFLMIFTAAYYYRFTGAITIVLTQILLIYLVLEFTQFEVVQLTFISNILITSASMLALGLLVISFTSKDKEERDTLRRLAKENDSQRSRLKAIIDTLRSAIFVVDKSGHIILHNGTASTLCSASEDIKGQLLSKVLPMYVRTDPDAKPVELISKDGESQHRRDLRLSTPNNQQIDLDVTVTPVELHNLRTTDYVIICEDITHELSIEDRQTEFIAVASHELRTPIAIIEATLSTVLHAKEPLPPAIVAIIEQAHTNSLLLGGIVTDLAMLREAKNDNIPVQLDKVDSAMLASQIGNDFRQQIIQKGLKFECHIDKDLPVVLSTERHIREILQNYMTNAIKYSNEGTITLRVSATKTGGIIFSVKDTGIGMSANDLKNLFNKFFRASDYRTQQVGGTGLGLYLCKGLAERLGGKVWCESALDQGSTFFLEIPPFSGLRRDQTQVVEAEVSNLLDSI